VGLISALALLAVLAMTVGLGQPGIIVGTAVAVTVWAALSLGLDRSGRARLGPADRVTLCRATLVAGIAALTADSVLSAATTGPPVTAVVALAIIALVLDAVDGWVARRTRTCSALGARFDMEVDALLILVLSVCLAPSFGYWVLMIGAARYLFAAAGRVLPWLTAPLPRRYWRKLIAAVQGVTLTAAVAGVLPPALLQVALLLSFGLLVESFGHDVRWLRRHRPSLPDTAAQARRGKRYEPTIRTALDWHG